MCMSDSNGINVFFQSGGGGAGGAPVTAQVAKKVTSGVQVHQPREVVLVSKTHICSLNLLPLSGEVWL